MRPTNLEPHIQTLQGIRARHRAMTLLELLIVLSVISILAGILFPVFSHVRNRARRTVCLSNMKQAGLAIRLYMDDYDQRYPAANPADYSSQPPNYANVHVGFCQGLWEDQTSWVDVVLPYVNRSGSNADASDTSSVRIPPIFYCPADMRRFVASDADGPDPRKAKSSYEYKQWLAMSHAESEIISPAKMALLWERYDYHHGGRRNEWNRESVLNLLLIDGHLHWTRLADTNMSVSADNLFLGPDLHNLFPGTGPSFSDYGEDIP